MELDFIIITGARRPIMQSRSLSRSVLGRKPHQTMVLRERPEP
jgi:hypothetical protein